mmetsp:Transcript_29337/g.78767  ORF Transcript_29337/g.78767 Transcript_29337/m.78767 type:complete len:234 (+) Transcript_29337:311-1012(+)
MLHRVRPSFVCEAAACRRASLVDASADLNVHGSMTSRHVACSEEGLDLRLDVDGVQLGHAAVRVEEGLVLRALGLRGLHLDRLLTGAVAAVDDVKLLEYGVFRGHVGHVIDLAARLVVAQNVRDELGGPAHTLNLVDALDREENDLLVVLVVEDVRNPYGALRDGLLVILEHVHGHAEPRVEHWHGHDLADRAALQRTRACVLVEANLEREVVVAHDAERVVLMHEVQLEIAS